MDLNLSSSFTVLLPVYYKDDPALFKRALASIYLNSLQPNELLIVGDGELTCELLFIINEFKKNGKLRLLQLKSNCGLAKALNYGLYTVSSKYTIRADADDYNLPNRFEEIIARLDEGYDVVGSTIKELDENGVFMTMKRSPLKQDEILRFVKRRNPFNHMSVGFVTDAVRNVGGYPNIYLKEDYALWATIIARGFRVCNLDVTLVEATTGISMLRRRGGLNYAISEIDLQRHLVNLRLKSCLSGIRDGFLRAAVFLLPTSFRMFFYKRFLRGFI